MDKLFSTLSAEERQAWIADFQTWVASKFPALEDASCAWSSEDREQIP